MSFAVVMTLLVAMLAPSHGGFEARADDAEHQSVLRLSPDEPLPATRHVKIGLNKSMIVELPREVRDVLVSDPKKLDAIVHTGRRAYLIGVDVGQANVFFFAKDGAQLLTLEVTIARDLTAITAMLHRLIPESKVVLEAVGDNIVLTGRVRNAADASRAGKIAGRLVDDEEGKKIVNMLAVDSKEQVLLKVTIAEMERNTIKQLGIDLDVLFNRTVDPITGLATRAGKLAFGKLSNLKFPFNGKDQVSTAQSGLFFDNGSGDTASAVIRALEQNGLIRTLAEPTLTAISGETASFLAGGEFPIPIAQDNLRISVEFKPFGVGLSFTPVVLSEGRISMNISTEVSELSNENAISLGTLTIPGLKVRRTNTTVELPSGGSLVIAGLITEKTKQAMTGYPGLKNLPILGTLFRSRDFKKSESELVVIVTPYIVDPVARAKLARPDDGFAVATDAKSYLLGHLNRVYGARPDGPPPPGGYKGDYGFIID